jgi:hypothetical protein
MRHLKFIILFTGLLFSLPFTSSSQEIIIEGYTGIKITTDDGPGIFPKSWYSKRINALSTPLAATEVTRCKTILSKAFRKYPDKILTDHLDRIYVLKNLSFFGVPYGGTNYKNTVYMTDDETNLNYVDDYIEGVFHHEFSSILLRVHSRDFPMKEWKQAAPPGFNYGNGGVSAIINGTASLDFDPKLNEEGFLTAYSVSSPEEDINVYAQNLFSGGSPFWAIFDKYEKVRAKTGLVIRFYHQLDPRFTESYFRGL